MPTSTSKEGSLETGECVAVIPCQAASVRVCGFQAWKGQGLSENEVACCRTALQYGEADIGGQDFSGQVIIAGCLPLNLHFDTVPI